MRVRDRRFAKRIVLQRIDSISKQYSSSHPSRCSLKVLIPANLCSRFDCSPRCETLQSNGTIELTVRTGWRGEVVVTRDGPQDYCRARDKGILASRKRAAAISR